MTDEDLTRLEHLLRDKAAEVPLVQAAPPRMLARARRRVVRNVLGCVVAAGLIVFGASAGLSSLRALRGPNDVVPGSPGAHPPAPSGRCTSGDLRATPALQGAAGSVLGSIVVTDIGAGDCTLEGRPTVTLLSGAGQELSFHLVEVPPQWKVDRAPTPRGWPVVTLRPGATAAIRVRWANACPQLTDPARWRIDLGSGGGALDMTGSIEAPSCLGSAEPSTLEVGPFEPSAGGVSGTP
jgi:hypothetical protein